MQGVQVVGKITDDRSKYQTGNPLGWYQAGVAWYYRPLIESQVSLAPEPGKETAANIAAHEVCHAKNPHHDLAHWSCMNKWAVPTYPRPE